MNRQKMEQWILLQDAGELDAIRAWLLRRAIRRDAGLQAFQKDLAAITSSVHDNLSDAPVRASTLDAIQAEAESYLEKNQPRELAAPFIPRPAYAFAALVVLLAAGAFFLRSPESAPQVAQNVPAQPVVQESTETFEWDDGLDTAVSEVELSLASATDDWTSNGTSATSDTDELVEELMALEESRI